MIHIFLLLTLLTVPFIAQAEEEDALRLKLTRAQLYLQTNQKEKALELLESLKAEYPDNPAVLAAEADAYLQSGYRGRSLGLMQRLAVVAPEEDTLRSLRERASSGDTAFASIEENVRFTGDELTEYLSRFMGSVPYSKQLAVGMMAEHNRVDADIITRLSGNTGAYKGENERGELYLAYNSDEGNRATASLFLAEGVTGLGFWHSWLDNYGTTSLELNFQRPDWDFIEQVIDRGRRDKVQVSRTHLFTPRLNVTANAALNRYGLAHEDNIANSATVSGGVSYLLPPFRAIDLVKHHAALWLDYGLDIEHPFEVEERTDANGFLFTPLPLESREVHSLALTFSQDIGKDFSYEIFGGYAYDRLGGDGPLAGAYLTWWPLKQLALEGNISRSIRNEASTETVDTVGIRGKWLF